MQFRFGALVALFTLVSAVAAQTGTTSYEIISSSAIYRNGSCFTTSAINGTKPGPTAPATVNVTATSTAKLPPAYTGAAPAQHALDGAVAAAAFVGALGAALVL